MEICLPVVFYISKGRFPYINTLSTSITDLKSSEPMEFADITKIFNLPSEDGLVIEYKLEDGEDQFKRFFEVLKQSGIRSPFCWS